MSAGFTPAPWEITPSAVFNGYEIVQPETRRRIAYTGEDEANTRLIAAAPELYEAARLLVDAGNMSVFDGGANSAMAKAFDAAERGLAKARGEQ